MKVRELNNGPGIFYFACPGCKCHHSIATKEPAKNGAVWRFNNDLDRPTFAPSINVVWRNREGEVKKICHSYITNGEIQFLEDSTHSLAGKVLDLPDLE
jgi:hypothetical protein